MLGRDKGQEGVEDGRIKARAKRILVSDQNEHCGHTAFFLYVNPILNRMYSFQALTIRIGKNLGRASSSASGPEGERPLASNQVGREAGTTFTFLHFRFLHLTPKQTMWRCYEKLKSDPIVRTQELARCQKCLEFDPTVLFLGWKMEEMFQTWSRVNLSSKFCIQFIF